MPEITNEEIMTILAPFGGCVTAFLLAVWRFRQPINKIFDSILKSFMKTQKQLEKENIDLKGKIQELSAMVQKMANSLEKGSGMSAIARGEYIGKDYIETLIFKEDKSEMRCTCTFYESMTITDQSLSDYLIEIAKVIRARRGGVKKFVLDFSKVDYINSQGQGNFFRLLEDFKKENGFELIIIPPIKKGNSTFFFRSLKDVSENITGMKIDAIKEDITSP